MSHITVDDRQAKIISESTDEIEIRDSSGKLLGYVAHQFTVEDIAVARERLASGERRYETKQVLDQLQALDQK